MKTANHYLTDTTTKTNFPAATILPHDLSRVWLWKPGYWFRWQQHQTVCSSHVLTPLRCELMLHSWKINWRLLSSGFQSEQLKWAQTFTHRGVRFISSRTNCQWCFFFIPDSDWISGFHNFHEHDFNTEAHVNLKSPVVCQGIRKDSTH